MILSETEGHFWFFETFIIPITQEISRVLTVVCLHINHKVHRAYDLNFIVKGEGLLKVTGSHVHVQCKSVDSLEMVIEIEML